MMCRLAPGNGECAHDDIKNFAAVCRDSQRIHYRRERLRKLPIIGRFIKPYLCPFAVTDKPMTNADRILTMSEEQLVDLLQGENGYCHNLPECLAAIASMDKSEEIPDNWCRECIRKWLRSPVEHREIPLFDAEEKLFSGLLEE